MDFASLTHKLKAKKIPLIVALVALLGGGGAFHFLHGKKASHETAHHEEEEIDSEDESVEAEADDDEDDEETVADQHSAHGEGHGEHAVAKHEGTQAAPAKEGWVGQVVDIYVNAIYGVQAKVDELRNSEIEKQRLALENANLRLKLEALHLDCQTTDAERRTQEIADQLEKETGARVGRTIGSIHYRPPTNLLPSQLYTLGVSYFKTEEFEKSAVILSFLGDLENNDNYRSPKDLLMTGVSWYRIDNFELANRYFDRVIQTKENPEVLKVQAQARLWKALVAERLKKHSESQRWLRDLLDHHPHSSESVWVNTFGRHEVRREVASEKPEKRPENGEHKEDEEHHSHENHK